MAMDGPLVCHLELKQDHKTGETFEDRMTWKGRGWVFRDYIVAILKVSGEFSIKYAPSEDILPMSGDIFGSDNWECVTGI